MAKQYFKKGDIIKQCEVVGDKVNTYCSELGIYNPTLEEYHSVGWEDYTPPTPPPYVPTREEKIQKEIREKYTESDEWMLNRMMNEANDPNSTMSEEQREEARSKFYEYNEYVKSVIAKYTEE